MTYKVLLVGDSNVGKADILCRFCEEEKQDFNSSTLISTVGIAFKVKSMEFNGQKMKLQLWDTAGHERFRTIATSYIKGSHGIMLVYDITNEKSYENIKSRFKNMQNMNGREVMLVGNHCHLEKERKVCKMRAHAFAAKHGIKFMEISTQKNMYIDEAFHELVERILSRTSEPSSNCDSNRKKIIICPYQRCITSFLSVIMPKIPN